MSEFYENDITIYQWLNYFSARSNHWILKHWKKNKEKFFDRFMIMGDQELFIICDKEAGDVYEFVKPNVVQLSLENLL